MVDYFKFATNMATSKTHTIRLWNDVSVSEAVKYPFAVRVDALFISGVGGSRYSTVTCVTSGMCWLSLV